MPPESAPQALLKATRAFCYVTLYLFLDGLATNFKQKD